MSIKYNYHLVIPEDNANRHVIVGFANHLDIDSRLIQLGSL